MPARADNDICNMALVYAGVNQQIGSLTQQNSQAAQACNTVYAEIRRQILSKFRWPFSIKRAQLSPYTGVTYTAAQTFNLGDLTAYGANVYRALLGVNTGHQPDLNASAAWWAQITRDGWAYTCPVPPDFMEGIMLWEKLSVSGLGSPPLFSRDQSDANIRNPRAAGRTPFSVENANDSTDALVLLTDLDAPILEYVAEVTNPSAFPTMFTETFAWHLAVPLAMALRGDEKKAGECKKMADRTLSEAYVVSMRGLQQDEEPVSEFEAARGGIL